VEKTLRHERRKLRDMRGETQIHEWRKLSDMRGETQRHEWRKLRAKKEGLRDITEILRSSEWKKLPLHHATDIDCWIVFRVGGGGLPERREVGQSFFSMEETQ
jgi:hypothetical protein